MKASSLLLPLTWSWNCKNAEFEVIFNACVPATTVAGGIMCLSCQSACTCSPFSWTWCVRVTSRDFIKNVAQIWSWPQGQCSLSKHIFHHNSRIHGLISQVSNGIKLCDDISFWNGQKSHLHKKRRATAGSHDPWLLERLLNQLCTWCCYFVP